MERVFYILPPHEKAPQHLIVEADEDQLSFLFYRDDNEVDGIVKYVFPQKASAQEMAAAINRIRAEESELQHSFRSVTVFYNFKTFTLIPLPHYNPLHRKEYLDLQFGPTGDVELYEQKVKGKPVMSVYRIPREVDDALKQNFPAAVFHLSSACQVAAMKDGNIFDIIFYKNKFKVLVQQEEKLQMVQIFTYTNEADVLYHLLNTCRQLNISPAETNVRLSGMIEVESSLYTTIRQYFRELNLSVPGDGIGFLGETQDLPQHYFHHLIAFIPCVS